jgi:hypothetical protein
VLAPNDITRSSATGKWGKQTEAMAGFQLSQRSGRNAKSQEEGEAQEESKGQKGQSEGQEGETQSA